MNGLIDILWRILAVLGFVLGSAMTLLLLAAVVKWLISKPEGWDTADDEEEAPPLEGEVLEDPIAGDTLSCAEPGLDTDAAESVAPDWDDWQGDPDAPPPEVRSPGPRERTRRLLATNDVFHADVLSAVLRDAGIWSFVHGNADAVGATGIPATGLYVAERDLERAKTIVEEAESRAAASRLARGAAHCGACGYDLRGTPDRCPECGTAVSLS